MANVTGFLLRTNLDDQGTLPRSGSWTGCPDICVGGTAAISQNDLIQKYGQVFDATLTQGLQNNIYVRAKNMNSAPLSQKVFLFQVAGSLVLRPELWYAKTNLLDFVPPDGDPTDPTTWVNNQVISAGAGNITATGAFNWKPQTTDHHCLVAVVADSWDSVLANYPTNIGSTDALAQWIYGSGNLGWHNVNIQPVTSTIYEDWTGYSNSDQKEEKVTFTMIANNVPVGARVSFSSNTSTKSGEVIGQDWTPVPKGGDPNNPVNPDFEVGSTVTVDANFETIITYRTDFNGLPVPKGFSQTVQATVVTTKPAPKNLLMSRFIANDTFAASYARSFSPNALFRGPGGEVHGVGYDGFVRMMTATGVLKSERRLFTALGGPPNGGGDHHIGNKAIVVIGSNTTRPEPA